MPEKSKLTADIEIKDLPEMNLACVRHVGPYKGNEALFKKLFTDVFNWAGPRGLVRFPETRAISVYHDNPETTEESKSRISVGITVPEDAEVDGEISKMKIGGGKFAVARFEINPDQYEDAWNAVKDWFQESEFEPDDRLCFENYLNNPGEHPEGKHIVEICAPVKPR